jgi:16S rRNA (cytosine1402-N4)-methyltransferase
MQFDRGYRGFSFSKEGKLDMRMDPSTDVTAQQIVNRASEKELGQIFLEYGEEPQWRRAAKAIVQARKKGSIETTIQLAQIIVGALGFRGKGRLHPATLIFQALRIAVNRELDAIQSGLEKAISLLAHGGRLGVLSFHSLEDRIAKNLFRTAAKRDKREGTFPLLKLLTKKPLQASLAEQRLNPRSRSAKLRFAERT